MSPLVQGLMAFITVFIFSGLFIDFFWGFFIGATAFFLAWYTAIPKEKRGVFLDNWRKNIKTKTVKCPECKKTASISASVCQNCSLPFSEEILEKAVLSEKNAIILKTSFFLVFIGLIGFIYVHSMFYEQDRASVYNSPADGSVQQVRDYLRDNLKDPRSVEYIEWSRVMPTDNGYLVSVKYRAKNSFGGYVVEQNTFILDKTGRVIRMSGQ